MIPNMASRRMDSAHKGLDGARAMDTFLGLVHHPVLTRAGDVGSTALTNVDVHDIARSARTYGISGVYVVTPVQAQQRMVTEIVRHWTDGYGAERNPRRARAMRAVTGAPSIEAVRAAIEARTGRQPVVAMTSARAAHEDDTAPEDHVHLGYADVRARMRSEPEHPPLLLLFGTGWGLAPAACEHATWRLPPVQRAADVAPDEAPYNHLSVRAAVAIILDRLFGDIDVAR
jgi:hypothetical protein